MLKVEGIEPSRIQCRIEDGVHLVRLGGCYIARLEVNGNVDFYGSWGDEIRRDAHAVVNAAIDEWRASGGKRLWPEPPREPVQCVCGGAPMIGTDTSMLYSMVVCSRASCHLRANTVEEWNPMQDTLKKLKSAKEAKS